MAGYLDQYGAGDEQRAKRIKIAVLTVVCVAALSGLLYFFFRNYRQEHQAKRFFELLVAGQYEPAYAMWVSSDDEKRAYPIASFMQDWAAPGVQVKQFDILDAESCGNTVIVDADLGRAGHKKLWVNRQSLELGFPPYEQCPQGNRIYDLYRNVKYSLHGRTYK